VEDGAAGLGEGGEALMVEHLVFETAPKAFDEGIVLVIEGCGGHLVFFRPRKILEPAAFPRFQDEVRTLARLFPGEMQIPARTS
jgi:hypothetical protein